MAWTSVSSLLRRDSIPSIRAERAEICPPRLEICPLILQAAIITGDIPAAMATAIDIPKNRFHHYSFCVAIIIT